MTTDNNNSSCKDNYDTFTEEQKQIVDQFRYECSQLFPRHMKFVQSELWGLKTNSLALYAVAKFYADLLEGNCKEDGYTDQALISAQNILFSYLYKETEGAKGKMSYLKDTEKEKLK
jgi:hypothetical protein